MIIVNIALATLCIVYPPDELTLETQPQQCYPVLVGEDTPRGEYELSHRLVESPGYGGDVLQFKEDELEVFAIHRVWLLRPQEKREERLKRLDPRQRRITKGCVNVDPEVYEKLVDCCSTSTLTIQ